jgi:hypothetical protein
LFFSDRVGHFLAFLRFFFSAVENLRLVTREG